MPNKDPGNDVSGEVVRLVLGLMSAMKDHLHDRLAEFDLTPSQAAALRSLGQARSQRDLAKCLHFDASNVTAIVDRLEERGLVERKVDREDRRIRRVVITREGDAVLRKLFERLIDDASPLRVLTPAEQKTLRNLLAKMVDPIELSG